MGFREFISNFRYRRRLEADLNRRQNIQPPANPTPRHIENLVAALLNKNTAWDARHELSQIGATAVPSLISALRDPRYERAKWDDYAHVPTPLESVLDLL